MIETEVRLQNVENVHQYLGASVDLQPAFVAERLAEQHFWAGCDESAPTIGCEIELRWTDLFPDLAEEFLGTPDKNGMFPIWVNDLSNESQDKLKELIEQNRAELIPTYQALEQLGIPAGKDAVWEFAFNPAYSAKLAAAEVGLLFSEGVISEASNPLHVTLGGLAIDDKVFGYTTMLTELFGSTGQRIREGIPIPDGPQVNVRWARKLSNGGWAPRQAYEFDSPSIISGIEMRSLVASSAEQISQTLMVAQSIGCAALKRENGDTVVWDALEELAQDLLVSSGLPNTSWRSPADKPETWQTWASVLDDHRAVTSLRADVLSILA